MKKIYTIGERAAMAELRAFCQKVESVGGLEILYEPFRSLDPKVLSTNAQNADAFLVYFMQNRKNPSRFFNFELDMVVSSICSRPNAYRPLFVVGTPEAFPYRAGWLRYMKEDRLYEIPSLITDDFGSNLSGIVVEEDDGYHD